MPRRHHLMMLALVVAVGACGRGAPAHDEILWDTWGVPHVYGTTDEAVFHGQGWAQMASHGDLILRLYGQARGRAAEYWGEDYLDSDRWVRTMGIPQRGEAWVAAQTPAFQRNIEAFARGMNDYAAAHPDAISDEVKAVLPVTAADVMAHGNRVIHFTFVTNEGVVRQARRALAEGGWFWGRRRWSAQRRWGRMAGPWRRGTRPAGTRCWSQTRTFRGATSSSSGRASWWVRPSTCTGRRSWACRVWPSASTTTWAGRTRSTRTTAPTSSP